MGKIKLKNDYLNRGRYARSLCRIIADYEITVNRKDGNSDGTDKKEGVLIHKPLNSTDNKAFIIAVSAPWGYGKTTFMNLLKDVLLGKGIETGAESFKDIPKLTDHEVTVYNTWINDFYDNPLEPFLKMLIKTVFKAQLDKVLIAKGVEAYGKSVMDSATTAIINNTNLESIINPSASVLTAIPEFFYRVFTQRKNVMRAMEDETYFREIFNDDSSFESQVERIKDFFQEQIQKNKDKKIVIIIDELDRCKPTFAIQTLEIVKHLFNIPGIVYIFSMDITQLQHCVKTVYGNDFDAIGYLERFFDYTTLLPQGSIEELFNKTFNEFNENADVNQVRAYYRICSRFHLSVREIRAICSSFHYLDNYELQEYPNHAKQLYFYLLVLKYKEPVKVMNALSDSKAAEAIRKEILNDYDPVFDPSHDTLQYFSEVFKLNPIIKDYANYVLIGDDGQRKTNVSLSFPSNTTEQVSMNGGSLSHLLFEPDIRFAEEIKDFHILEYLFRKVELYDTAIPQSEQHQPV